MATQLIHRVKCHPTLPLTITAHDDHHIRFFDNNSGKMVHSMVAHLDAVTSLAVDPNGLYLLSGSKTFAIINIITAMHNLVVIQINILSRCYVIASDNTLKQV